MHIQKLLPICVAALVVASSYKLYAADTDLQAKAREALRQKMSELDNPGSSTNSSTSSAPVAPAAPVVTTPAPEPVVPPAPAPEPAPAAPTPTATVQGRALSSEELEKALAAERAEIARLQEADRAKAETMPKEKEDGAMKAREEENTAAAKKAEAAAAKKAKANEMAAKRAEADAKARAKREQEKQADMAKFTPAPESTIVSPRTTAPAPAMHAPTAAEISKEQKLNELLQRYKADKISPTEYHQERAKIMAEP